MNKYEVIRTIGQGTYGAAVLVIKDGKEYVMKQIVMEQMSLKERQDSVNEVEILNMMEHPNVIRYWESFLYQGSLMIVTDFCSGGDLARKIGSMQKRKTGPCYFTEKECMFIFIQICLALQHVHRQNVLHRDLKTQNVFLTSTGCVKLGDFGIAKLLTSQTSMARTMIGSPFYMSPELCQDQPYNAKSDIWALGCVLYEICTGGRRPFEGANMGSLILKIIKGTYTAAMDINLGESAPVPKDLSNLIDLLLHEDPIKRPTLDDILNTPYVSQWFSRLACEHAARLPHLMLAAKQLLGEGHLTLFAPQDLLPRNDQLLTNNQTSLPLMSKNSYDEQKKINEDEMIDRVKLATVSVAELSKELKKQNKARRTHKKIKHNTVNIAHSNLHAVAHVQSASSVLKKKK
eukprot:GHVL01002226.1.p1 GENE.GHVL01002226.1~~GHVL01002226.1.p1  ORF type:complete len:403 (-),score=65.59 GHVL01002226.1:632-1840(-)